MLFQLATLVKMFFSDDACFLEFIHYKLSFQGLQFLVSYIIQQIELKDGNSSKQSLAHCISHYRVGLAM